MYDVIIIGAGPAGISAGLYIKRANLKVLILYKNESALEKTDKIENYYGFEKGVSGKDLYSYGINQALNIGIEVKKEEITSIKIIDERKFEVISEKEAYKTKAVIIATGNKKNIPNIAGVKEFEGKGVSYCAICDGFFFRGKDVAVLGNGKYAVSEANELVNIAKTVTILTDGEDFVDRETGIKINKRKIHKVLGDNRLEGIEFEDNSKIKIDGLFIALGVASGNDFARKLGVVTKNNNIIVDEKMRTNIDGIFACGDCVGGLLQISKSVYEGTVAGLETINYVRKSE